MQSTLCICVSRLGNSPAGHGREGPGGQNRDDGGGRNRVRARERGDDVNVDKTKQGKTRQTNNVMDRDDEGRLS